ncbi:MAG: stage III sporulation protein AF [Ruminococcus sp.]|jgi:hypothetical protein|nr:stage III sporulation protein AF [Ruminococcus sp.]
MEGFRLAAGVACFIGIVIALVDALAPSEKFKKQLKVMFAVIFMLAVITPIADGSIDFSGDTIAAYADTDYLAASKAAGESYLETSIGRNISRNIDELLKAENIYAQKIETSINILDNGSIDITVIDLTVDEKEADRASEILSEKLSGEEFTVNIFAQQGM